MEGTPEVEAGLSKLQGYLQLQSEFEVRLGWVTV